MDLRLQKEAIAVKETVLDTCIEQSVETDYILPDYFPDIFRILKCTITPRIISHSIIGKEMSGNSKKLNYELEAVIKVWYLSENSKIINCIEQKTVFTKSIELTIEAQYPEIRICPKCDYANCRVINKRRLDIRGAISAKIKVIDDKCKEIITNAEGRNIQLKKDMIIYPSKRIIASKKITVIEELELGIAKPPILSVIKSDSKIISKEHKTISNKVVVKGEAQIEMLYICSGDDDHGIESMKFTIPFSQIIDMDGIDESYDLTAELFPSSCDIITKGNGEATSFECELVIFVNCVASKSVSGDIITDAYSTEYECDITTENLSTQCIVKEFSENTICKNTLTLNDGEISSVIDCCCDITNVSTHLSESDEGYIINGNVCFSALVITSEGYPLVCESDGIFEHKINCLDDNGMCILEPDVSINGCNYTLSGESTVDVTADLSISGKILSQYERLVITDIKIYDEQKKSCSDRCALKLYFADKNEDIWEIAKRNSTSVKAILEENNITSDKIFEKGMLLIPIIS